MLYLNKSRKRQARNVCGKFMTNNYGSVYTSIHDNVPMYMTIDASNKFLICSLMILQNHPFFRAQENPSETKNMKSSSESTRLNSHTLSPANNCLYLSSKLKVVMQQRGTVKQVIPGTGSSSLHSYIPEYLPLYSGM